MDTMLSMTPSRRFPAIIVLAVAGQAAALLAAACGPTRPPPTTVVFPPTIPVASSPTALPPPATPAVLVSPSHWPLTTTGPWLVYRVGDGFVVANPDGSGRRSLFEDGGLGPAYLYDLDSVASASGGWIALYTFDDSETMAGPSLQLVHVPDGIVRWSTPLLSDEIEADLVGGVDAGSPASDAAQAVTMQGSLAWSPDGQRLAFVAALDGPSSDLYVYDVEKGRLRRVTSGPNQIASLSWSPDGLWIAHQAVESFGSGAGWTMGAVWVVSPDGRQLNKMYAPNSGGEVFLGWSAGGSLVAYSFSGDGPHDVRAAGVDGIENVLIPAYFNDAAYAAEDGAVAYAVPTGMAYTGTDPGAYLWHVVGGSTNRIDPGDWSEVQWSEEAGRFFFEGAAGVLAVSPDGITVESLPIVDRVLPSPDGRLVALWGDGYFGRASDLKLFTVDLVQVKTLDQGDFPILTWRPDSAGLLAIGEAGLMYYPLDGPPTIVDPSAEASLEGGMGWVLP